MILKIGVIVRISKKPEERRREIVSASRELFLKHDYENISMQDIVKKLQIAKGTIYYYFKSKTELLEAVVQDIVDEYLEIVKKALNESQGNALDKIRTLIVAGKIPDNQNEIKDKLHRPGNAGLHIRLLAVFISRLAPLYVQVIQQGCEEGLFYTDFPLESAEVLLAGIQFLTDLGCYPWSKEDLIRRTTAIPSIMETLLHAPRGSFDFLLTQTIK